MCHVTEAESATDAACDASQHADMTCIECHTDESQLATMHEGKTTGDRMPMRLKKTTVDKSLCTPCHDQATIAAASADCTVLTDVNGKTVNPHELPEMCIRDSTIPVLVGCCGVGSWVCFVLSPRAGDLEPAPLLVRPTRTCLLYTSRCV